MLAAAEREPELQAGGTVAHTRRALGRIFRQAGLDSPEADARILLQHVLGLKHNELTADGARAVSNGEIEMIRAAADRRLQREPVAYITGQKEFWSLPLKVTPATLVPRPETETVVSAALDVLACAGKSQAPLRIADVGTGSGALLLALLKELPQAFGVGVDISADAITVARENARKLGLAERAAFIVTDFCAALAPRSNLVVSNPPYLRTSELRDLAPEVREHEPRRALDGGEDGLRAYRAIAAQIGGVLAPGGTLVVEIGHTQAQMVTAVFAEAKMRLVTAPVRDLAGAERALILCAEW